MKPRRDVRLAHAEKEIPRKLCAVTNVRSPFLKMSKKTKKPKKEKKKLTPEQRRAKKRRNQECETIFINGKQKRVRREPTIDGLPTEEFICNNADPIWLHQNEYWERMESARSNPSS